MERLLKIYPCKYWGDSVSILGNREGLQALKECIENALTAVEPGEYQVFVEKTNDPDTTEHEFTVACKLVNYGDIEKKWNDLPSHITEDDMSLTLDDDERAMINELLFSDK